MLKGSLTAKPFGTRCQSGQLGSIWAKHLDDLALSFSLGRRDCLGVQVQGDFAVCVPPSPVLSLAVPIAGDAFERAFLGCNAFCLLPSDWRIPSRSGWLYGVR